MHSIEVCTCIYINVHFKQKQVRLVIHTFVTIRTDTDHNNETSYTPVFPHCTFSQVSNKNAASNNSDTQRKGEQKIRAPRFLFRTHCHNY